MNELTSSPMLCPEGTSLVPLRRRDGQAVAFTRIDASDAPFVGQWTWRLSSDGYAVRSETRAGGRRTVYLHRELAQAQQGTVTDHVNGDRLNNTRANLRLATVGQNNANSVDRPRASGYRGVYWHGQANRWVAQISVEGRLKHLGLFDDPVGAAGAYDAAARGVWGRFARCNLNT